MTARSTPRCVRGYIRIASVIAVFLPVLFISYRDSSGTSVVVPLQSESGPAVTLTINGQMAQFGLDTGAGAHTLASWLVGAAGVPADNRLPMESEARDAEGERVEMQFFSGAVGRLENGDSLAVGPGIIVEFPSELQEENVGGLLNPQLLASGKEAAVPRGPSQATSVKSTIGKASHRTINLNRPGIAGDSNP